MRLLSPSQIRERLDERFRVLTGGSRDALPRQQTLRALIDWSHDMLDERERALFRRMAVFVNGFTLDAAVGVGSGPELDELDVFDVLASLVDKSLVLAEPSDDTLRYRLLESTRVYAREKLVNAGEQEWCAEKHARFLRDRFLAIEERYQRTGRSAEEESAFAAEREDIRSALDWARGGDPTLGAELLVLTRRRLRGRASEFQAIERTESFLALLPDGESRLLSLLWQTLAALSARTKPLVAMEAATKAILYARAADDRTALVEALLRFIGTTKLRDQFAEGEAALREVEAMPGIPAAQRIFLLRVRRLLSAAQGDYATAERASDQSRKLNRTLGNTAQERIDALNVAELAHAQGATARAIALVRDVLAAARAYPERVTVTSLLCNAAGYLAALDDLPGAIAMGQEALHEFASRPPDGYEAVAIEHLALAYALGGDVRRGAVLEGYSDAAQRRYGYERQFTETTTHERLVAVLRERLSAGELSQLLADGSRLTDEEAIALAQQPA